MDTVRQSIKRVEECMAQAEKFYGCRFWISEILFDLKGTTAGMFCVRGDKRQYIRINRILLDANPDEFFKQTIPHEVAHLIARQMHGPRIGHGPLWKAIMRKCFGLVPDRCHDMDTSVSSACPYVYSCDCTTHNVSKRVHNAIVRRPGSRFCKSCKATLKFNRIEVVEKPVLAMGALFVSAGAEKLTPGDVAKVLAIVGKHQVGKLILGPGCSRCTTATKLREKLGVRSTDWRVHENQSTLPGGLTHAVIIAVESDQRAIRAATVLRERGVKVRLLARQDAR